jgi:hypothetical protein
VSRIECPENCPENPSGSVEVRVGHLKVVLLSHFRGVADPLVDDVSRMDREELGLSAGPAVDEELRPEWHASLLDRLLGVDLPP